MSGLSKAMTRADLPIAHYTSNKITKGFIIGLARKKDPGFKPRPGVRYRLNRWREEQLTAGKRLTYGALARQLYALSRPETEFKRIAHGRYMNFVSGFMKHHKDATHAKAVSAWNVLKELPVAKDYGSWLKTTQRNRGETAWQRLTQTRQSAFHNASPISPTGAAPRLRGCAS